MSGWAARARRGGSRGRKNWRAGSDRRQRIGIRESFMVADPTRARMRTVAPPMPEGIPLEVEPIRPGAHERRGEGLRVTRAFTQVGQDPYDTIEWANRASRITNPDGSVVFEMKDAEIPAEWSQV